MCFSNTNEKLLPIHPSLCRVKPVQYTVRSTRAIKTYIPCGWDLITGERLRPEMFEKVDDEPLHPTLQRLLERLPPLWAGPARRHDLCRPTPGVAGWRLRPLEGGGGSGAGGGAWDDAPWVGSGVQGRFLRPIVLDRSSWAGRRSTARGAGGGKLQRRRRRVRGGQDGRRSRVEPGRAGVIPDSGPPRARAETRG